MRLAVSLLSRHEKRVQSISRCNQLAGMKRGCSQEKQCMKIMHEKRVQSGKALHENNA